MKVLYLVKEPCTLWFDVKPIHDILGTEKLPSSIEVKLSEADYFRYERIVSLYMEWQQILESKTRES
jgi:hypothetical protein